MLATLSASRSNELIADGVPIAAALTSGYQLAFGVGAALVGVAIGVAVTVLERRAEKEAEVHPGPWESPGEPDERENERVA